jgi:hypothetical protein
VGERWDRLRSAVQRAAGAVKERAEDGTLAKIRKVAGEIGSRRARIPLSHLRRILITVPDVEAASLGIVTSEDGTSCLGVDLELTSQRRVRAELRFEAAQFAPHGAKELSFRVSPEESAAEPAIRELAGALAALVARTLWSASLPPASSAHESGLIDREGPVLRIDLRTIPSVRSAIARGPAVATILDMIVPEGVEFEPEGLVIRIGLPRLGA